jgi:hypothetical protein
VRLNSIVEEKQLEVQKALKRLEGMEVQYFQVIYYSIYLLY